MFDGFCWRSPIRISMVSTAHRCQDGAQQLRQHQRRSWKNREARDAQKPTVPRGGTNAGGGHGMRRWWDEMVRIHGPLIYLDVQISCLLIHDVGVPVQTLIFCWAKWTVTISMPRTSHRQLGNYGDSQTITNVGIWNKLFMDISCLWDLFPLPVAWILVVTAMNVAKQHEPTISTVTHPASCN